MFSKYLKTLSILKKFLFITLRPIRPNPLIATRRVMSEAGLPQKGFGRRSYRNKNKNLVLAPAGLVKATVDLSQNNQDDAEGLPYLSSL